MSKHLRFDAAQIGAFGEATYIMLKLSDYAGIVEGKKFIAEMKEGKSYTAEMKQYRQKRSLDANNYCWMLCQKLAEALRLTKEEVYLQHVKNIGQFEILPIREDALDKFIASWGKNGIGWPVEVLDDAKFPGYKKVAAYYGSSTYDSKEMALLIDNIVQDCKEQGIETLTPAELSRLKEEWNAKED